MEIILHVARGLASRLRLKLRLAALKSGSR